MRFRFAVCASVLATSMWFTGCDSARELLHSRAFTISSESMEPTVMKGDRVVVNTAWYRDHAVSDGDIVAFHKDEYIIMKRVSAVAGERIEGHDGVLYRNVVALNEPYKQFSKDNPLPQIETFGPFTVAPGEIFVTGDNRDASLDSRSEEFPHIKLDSLVGRVCTVVPNQPNREARELCQ